MNRWFGTFDLHDSREVIEELGLPRRLTTA